MALRRWKEFRKEFGEYLASLVQSLAFEGLILAVIILDALCIGVQASDFIDRKSAWYFEVFHLLFLSVYIFELLIRTNSFKLHFFKDWWNNFSLSLVVVDLVGLCVPLVAHGIGIFNKAIIEVLRVVKVIQALRALRVIRSIKFLKNLNIIVLTLLESIPAIGAIVITISLVLYIFAVVGRDLYGRVDPNRYGNLGRAVFTLFQLITLDDWFQMYIDINPGQEHVLVFLILFIAIETLIFINLFVAVIVDNLARAQSSDIAEYGDKTNTKVTSMKNGKNLEDPVSERIGGSAATPSGRMKKFGSGFESILTSPDDPSKAYLAELASLEHHFITAHKHRTTLNKLVDVVDLSKS